MHESIHPLSDIGPLRDPVLIAAFTGYTDSTGGAAAAVHYLEERWQATPLATIDPERFYDFTVERPHVLIEEGERALDWPDNTFSVASPPGAERDFLLLSGVEPHLRWRTFVTAIEDVLRATGSTTSVTLGAQPAQVPHTRPLGVTLSTSHAEFEAAFGLQAPASRYQGAVGILGVLNLHMRALGWKNASLWAMAPHYLTVGPNPNVAIALVRAFDRGFGTHTPLDGLEDEAVVFEQQVQHAMEDSDEVKRYIRQMEDQYDAEQRNASLPPSDTPPSDDTPLPSAPDLLDELERFLRDQRGGTG